MHAFQTASVHANGLDFATLQAGPEDAPLALCLHGFPDHARTWRLLLPALAEAGYRAVAPYMRGYAPTAIPADGRYQTAVLSQDVGALISALGAESAVVIGHDWGAIAAHGAAILAPQQVRKLVTMSVPHRNAGLALATQYAQQKRSWYMFFFQSFLADAAVAANDFAFIDELWRDWSPNYRLEAEEREALMRTFRTEGVLGAALGYYRAMFDPSRQDPSLAVAQAQVLVADIPVETLYLHGAQDGCMGIDTVDGLEAAFPKGLEKVILEKAGHFLHLEQPDPVHRAILEFLGEARD